MQLCYEDIMSFYPFLICLVYGSGIDSPLLWETFRKNNAEKIKEKVG